MEIKTKICLTLKKKYYTRYKELVVRGFVNCITYSQTQKKNRKLNSCICTFYWENFVIHAIIYIMCRNTYITIIEPQIYNMCYVNCPVFRNIFLLKNTLGIIAGICLVCFKKQKQGQITSLILSKNICMFLSDLLFLYP